MTGPVSSRFSPRTLEPAQLERLTVAREPLLGHLLDAITGVVVSGQARFDLVLGPRGAGKSHLLGVLEGRLQSSAQLADRTLVIAPPEELHPLSLVQLLALLLREFPDDPDLGPAVDALRSLQRQRDGDQERRAVDLIRGRLGGRSLVILLENLDEVFDALGRDGQLRLRNILQTERRWSIVATSRSLVPAFTKHEAPFHGTFNLHQLESLSAEDCRELLARLADAHDQSKLAELLRTPTGLARVRGLRHLLGGNPRAMALLFRQLDEHRLDQFELALADLADELEPYFRAQVARLSPGQRAIVEILAENWRPLTVTEIAERSFSSQASVSGALRNLRGDALVSVLKVGRERLYELGDPLHRLARANQRPRDAVVAFARVIRWWYADDSASNFSYPSRYVLPEHAQLERMAAEGLGERRVTRPELEEAAVDVVLAALEPDDAEARRSLIEAFDDASPARVRLLSDRVARSPALTLWQQQRWFADLGQLLTRLRPTRSFVSLEFGLMLAVGSAWHYGRVAELLPASGSLEPLLEILPNASRQQLSLAGANVPGLDTSECLAAFSDATLEPLEFTTGTAGVWLEAIVSALEDSPEQTREALASRDEAAALGLAHVIGHGAYQWLASRRPLERLSAALQALAARGRISDQGAVAQARSTPDAAAFRLHALVLQGSHTPRDAVARLSEVERDLIRGILELHDDREGLEYFALDAER